MSNQISIMLKVWFRSLCMVGRLFSLAGSGFWDWVLQRVSALVILSYSIFMAVFFSTHSGLDYATWMSLCSNFWFKLGTFLTFV